jgi:serine/threonine protein phosphatase PrpC
MRLRKHPRRTSPDVDEPDDVRDDPSPQRAPELGAPEPPPTLPLHASIADVEVVARSRPDAEIRGASLQGQVHRHLGTLRQDQLGLRVDPCSPWTVLAVADGLGSCEQSHLGARWAVEAACALLVGAADVDGLELDVPSVVSSIANHVAAEATRTEVAPLASVRTTLVAALVQHLEGGHADVLLLGVGDSGAHRLSGGGWHWELGRPSADGASNVVHAFLPDRADADGIEVAQTHLAPGDALVLGSDGFTDPMGDGDNPIGRYFAERWEQPPSTWRFGTDLAVETPGWFDDRTALALWPQEPAADAP